MTMEYQRHPESQIFPRMSPEEFNALVKSMVDHGFDSAFPIILYENMIVDGWHRYKAAKAADAGPVFREWSGNEARLRDFIIYANSTRRHLSKAAHAQALIIANATAPDGKILSPKEIAALTGAGTATVSEQQRIYDQDPDAAKQVAVGDMPATHARRKVLREQPELQAGHWVIKIPKRITDKAIPYALDLGETETVFVQTAVRERIERLARSENA